MRVRRFDRVVAALGLFVLAPLLGVIAVVVRATSRGPSLHRATRAGVDGRPFTLLKFRSMVVGAQHTGAKVTAAGDPRVTPVGRFLRAWKLDELPQLVNVVRGEMALVGPRPEDPAYVDLDDPSQRELYRHAPGITGAASLAFRDEEELLAAAMAQGLSHEEAYREIAAAKIAIDLDYLRHRTVWSDLGLIGRTLGSVVGWGRAGGAGSSTRSRLDRAYRAYEGDYAARRWGDDVPGNAAIVREREVALGGLLDLGWEGPVLDIGSGPATTFPGVFDPAEVVRLDLLLWRLEAGAAADSRLAVCADGTQLPVPDASVGVAVLGTVLSSLDEETGRAVLAEATRVVRPGGFAVVYDLRLPNPGNRSTRPVPRRWIERELQGFTTAARSVTLLPPLARRVGRSDASYRALAAIPLLRSHNLVVARRCES